MDFLKSILTVSAIGAVVYFVGMLLVEFSAAPHQMIVPRSRKYRYWQRSIAFFEYFLFIVLLFAILTLKKEKTDPFFNIAIISILSMAGAKLILLVFLSPTKGFAKWLLKIRFNTKLSTLLIFLWLLFSIYLMNNAFSKESRTIGYCLVGYGFLLTILIKARLIDFFIRVVADIELKDGKKLSSIELLDETNSYFILSSDLETNLLIPKDEIKKMTVKQMHPFSDNTIVKKNKEKKKDDSSVNSTNNQK